MAETTRSLEHFRYNKHRILNSPPPQTIEPFILWLFWIMWNNNGLKEKKPPPSQNWGYTLTNRNGVKGLLRNLEKDRGQSNFTLNSLVDFSES